MKVFRWGCSKEAAKKKILVVDDEPNIVRTVTDRLKMSGYDVIDAADGEEAIARALQEKPGLILLDIVMPGLDGYAVLERLRQTDETSSIPVIVLTARDQEADIARALALGAADYVVKPFDLVELLEKTKGLLQNDR